MRGASPPQAFRVECDIANNPPSHFAQGQLNADVQAAFVAPASLYPVPLNMATAR